MHLRHGVRRPLNRVLGSGSGSVFNRFHHCRTGPVSLALSFTVTVTDSDSSFGVYPGISLLFLIPLANGKAKWVDERGSIWAVLGIRLLSSFLLLPWHDI